MCGENRAKRSSTYAARGSSPRVRGKPNLDRANNALARLIPACAGKTPLGNAEGIAPPAHPRVCGENSVKTRLVQAPAGSSPRVRGKLVTLRLQAVRDRLIPACAGKTMRAEVTSELFRAHPRVCGENGNVLAFHGLPPGSSPRVRGKRIASRSARNCSGLIPACAGKTPMR